jgi:hypothetical protein
MIEKTFSIKDVIIYLIPGIINTFLFGLLISHFVEIDFLSLLKNNISLSIIGVLASFLIGFLISQIQIIISNKLLKKKFRVLRTLNKSIEVKEFKPVICNEIRKVFKMDDISNENLLKNEQILFFCYNLILEKADNRSVELINRAKNLASFATGLYLTIVLLTINLTVLIEFNLCVKLLFGLFNLIGFYIIRKITGIGTFAWTRS